MSGCDVGNRGLDCQGCEMCLPYGGELMASKASVRLLFPGIPNGMGSLTAGWLVRHMHHQCRVFSIIVGSFLGPQPVQIECAACDLSERGSPVVPGDSWH